MEKRAPQRIEESRRLELRINELRQKSHMNYEDPLSIPKEQIPDGWTYFWVRESVLNEPDTSRIVEMKRKGWTPVPSDRHPDYAFEDTFHRASHLKGYIAHTGLVLFERPTVICKEERQKRDAHNMRLLCSMPGTEDFMGDRHIKASFLSDPLPTIKNEYGNW